MHDTRRSRRAQAMMAAREEQPLHIDTAAPPSTSPMITKEVREPLEELEAPAETCMSIADQLVEGSGEHVHDKDEAVLPTLSPQEAVTVEGGPITNTGLPQSDHAPMDA